MKHLILLLGLMSMPLLATAQTGEFVTCRVIEKRCGKVKLEFSNNLIQLGRDYADELKSFNKKKNEFQNGETAVVCLSESYGWIFTGGEVQIKRNKRMWILKHEITKRAVNSTRNVRALGREGRRYYNEEDDIYFGFDRSRGR